MLKYKTLSTKKEIDMPLVKIGPKHQITIPKEVFGSLNLEAGDMVEITVKNGKGILAPKQVISKAPAPKLTEVEQKLLPAIKRKVQEIQKNIKKARGLTRVETAIAAKVGLVDSEQKWWWTEEWQSHEREAERNIEKGELSKTFDSQKDLIAHLHKQNA